MGTQDLPATIDFITKTTGYEKVNYVGHSEGTTQLIAASALKPEYFNSKINLAILLAPPVSMKHCKNRFLVGVTYPAILRTIASALEAVGAYDLVPYGTFTAGVTSSVCEVFDGAVCSFIYKFFASGDPDVDDIQRLPVYLSHLPAGSGYHNFIHYGQLMHTATEAFKRYDWGSDENTKRYGQSSPPDYDIGAINFPLALLGGAKDNVATSDDVAWLHKQLGDNVLFFKNDYNLDHHSFIIARNLDFFTKDAMAVLNHQNGKCDPSTYSSEFEIGNQKCIQ